MKSLSSYASDSTRTNPSDLNEVSLLDIIISIRVRLVFNEQIIVIPNVNQLLSLHLSKASV